MGDISNTNKVLIAISIIALAVMFASVFSKVSINLPFVTGGVNSITGTITPGNPWVGGAVILVLIVAYLLWNRRKKDEDTAISSSHASS